MRELSVIQSGIDASALGCSLDDQELAARTEQWRKVSARAQSRRTAPGRVVATYPKDDKLLGEIRRLIAAEAECCPSMQFTVDEQPDRVVVELRVAVAGNG